MTWYISMMSKICFLVAVFMLSPVTGRDSDNVAAEIYRPSNANDSLYPVRREAYACEQTPINPSTVSWDVPYTVEQFRYHVVIYGDTPLVCAGAIYLNTIVITSASCARQLKGVVILLGGYRPLPYTEGEQFHISVTYVPHSYYKPELGNTFDIAFFITSVEGRKVRFEYTNRVQPICVPPVSCQPIPRSANLTMSGLVYVDNSEPVLQLYPLVLVNRRICSKWRIGFKVAGHMLCATKLNGGSCEGFLGGPVIYKSEGNYLLAGVVSSCHSGDRVIITSINALYCPSPD